MLVTVILLIGSGGVISVVRDYKWFEVQLLVDYCDLRVRFCRLSCLLSRFQDQGTQTQIKKEYQTQMITNNKEIINQVK